MACPQGIGEVTRIGATRRHGTEEESAGRVGEGLVHRLPPGDEVPEGLRHPVHVPWPEVAEAPVVEEPAEVVGEPPGQGEVVQAHPEVEAGVATGGEDLAVVLDGSRVVLALPGLEAGPLQRQAVLGEPERPEQREVLPVAAGEAVAVAGGRGPTEPLPARPVAGGCSSLGLGARRTGAPQEPIGQLAHRPMLARRRRPATVCPKCWVFGGLEVVRRGCRRSWGRSVVDVVLRRRVGGRSGETKAAVLVALVAALGARRLHSGGDGPRLVRCRSPSRRSR